MLNNLQAVGIRAKLRPLERAAFFKGYSEKSFKNIIQGASGAFGNAATRLEAFVVKGGAYVYGNYPDIDALFQQQAAELDGKKREAMLHKIQQLVHERTIYAHIWQLAFINGVGPRVGESGLGLITGHAYSAPYEDVTLKRASGSSERPQRSLRRGQHDALHRSAARLLAGLAVPALAHHLPVRARDRRSGDAARRARREPGRHRRHPRAVRPRPAALGAVLELHRRASRRATSASRSTTARRCFELYLSRLPNSLLLALAAMAFSLLIGIPSGILAAVRVGRFWDRAGKVFSLLGLSLPSFWVGLVLILFFSVYLEWLPSSGSGTALHLLMPAFALGWYFAAAHMRLTRSSMLEVLGSEYIKLARLKGLPESLVIAKHAFKNALIPVLTLAGINLVIMINVAVVVETVFAWPGIGRLLYEGITFRDFPVVQAVVLLGGGMIVVVNLLIDILYAVIDPRIRLER